MAHAKVESNWDVASALLATIHNVNCIKDSDLRDASDFHPFESQKKKKVEVELSPQESVSVLKGLLLGK